MEYPDLSALPAELRNVVAAHGSLNVYRMVMRSPNLAPDLLAFGDSVLQANSLPPAWRELAILRVGHVHGADYQTHHHERIGRATGLDDVAIAAAVTGTSTGWRTGRRRFSSPPIGCSPGARLGSPNGTRHSRTSR